MTFADSLPPPSSAPTQHASAKRSSHVSSSRSSSGGGDSMSCTYLPNDVSGHRIAASALKTAVQSSSLQSKRKCAVPSFVQLAQQARQQQQQQQQQQQLPVVSDDSATTSFAFFGDVSRWPNQHQRVSVTMSFADGTIVRQDIGDVLCGEAIGQATLSRKQSKRCKKGRAGGVYCAAVQAEWQHASRKHGLSGRFRLQIISDASDGGRVDLESGRINSSSSSSISAGTSGMSRRFKRSMWTNGAVIALERNSKYCFVVSCTFMSTSSSVMQGMPRIVSANVSVDSRQVVPVDVPPRLLAQYQQSVPRPQAKQEKVKVDKMSTFTFSEHKQPERAVVYPQSPSMPASSSSGSSSSSSSTSASPLLPPYVAKRDSSSSPFIQQQRQMMMCGADDVDDDGGDDGMVIDGSAMMDMDFSGEVDMEVFDLLESGSFDKPGLFSMSSSSSSSSSSSAATDSVSTTPAFGSEFLLNVGTTLYQPHQVQRQESFLASQLGSMPQPMGMQTLPVERSDSGDEMMFMSSSSSSIADTDSVMSIF